MMRQAVGVGVERGVAQRAVLEHHRDRVRRARGLRGKQRRQRRRCRSRQRTPSRDRRRCARNAPVSFQTRRMVSRSAASRIDSAPSAPVRIAQPPPPAAGSAARPAPRRVAASNRSLAYSSTPSMPAGVPSAARRSISPTDRSNFALAVATGCGSTASPGSSSAPRRRASASNASITWNSGCRDSDRAGLSTSTSRSNGRSACAVGRKVAAPHPADQLPEARVARGVGAQHQRVDEEPDQIVQRRIGAPRDRAADRDVGAGPEPRQQRRQAPPAAP